MSLLIGTCDALTERLNQQQFSLAFTAVRRIQPVYKLETLGTLIVCVSPWRGISSIQSRTRGNLERMLHPCVTVAQRLEQVPENSDAAFEPLFDLVEELQEFLLSVRILSVPHRGQTYEVSQIGELENAPTYSEDHLREWNQFTSDLVVTYKC